MNRVVFIAGASLAVVGSVLFSVPVYLYSNCGAFICVAEPSRMFDALIVAFGLAVVGLSFLFHPTKVDSKKLEALPTEI